MVTWPDHVEWPWLGSESILGRPAEEDLLEIKSHDRGLARKLTAEAARLARNPLLVQIAEEVPDPPGIGPRYMVDLSNGHIAVLWVLTPPPQFSGAPPAIWVEQVTTRERLEAALKAEAVDKEVDPGGPNER